MSGEADAGAKCETHSQSTSCSSKADDHGDAKKRHTQTADADKQVEAESSELMLNRTTTEISATTSETTEYSARELRGSKPRTTYVTTALETGNTARAVDAKRLENVTADRYHKRNHSPGQPHDCEAIASQ